VDGTGLSTVTYVSARNLYLLIAEPSARRRKLGSSQNDVTEGRSIMKNLKAAALAAGGLAAAVVGLAAPANAAPAGPGNAQQTISSLQAQGYNVIVNRIGTTPLDQATVVAVRPGQTYSRTDSGTPGDSLETTVTDKTVYVDVK
jgi:hypothetical protein